jgi:hypothetical protein
MITDVFLVDIAKAFNGESFTIPTHSNFCTSTVTLSPTDTSLPGEVGARPSLSASRTSNEVTWSGIRTGAIVSTSGETLYSTGVLSASSSGDLFMAVTLPGLLHTTDYDIEVSWTTTFDRS